MTNETKKAIFEKYKVWRLLTKEDREKQGLPLTQREFSIHHGTTEKTLSLWNDKIEGESQIINGDYLGGKSKDVDEALVKACEKGNANALRTYYQVTKRLIEKREDSVKLEYTSDEIARDSNRFIEFLRNALEENGGTCPVCGKPSALLAEVCDNQES